MPKHTDLCAEKQRLSENKSDEVASWQRWGPYVSERSWGTVREDYSRDGNAWDYFPFNQASWKAYRWGEDGIAGICDRYQLLTFAPAFWNEKDSCLKERLFGLSSWQGNHGEDVKECAFRLDALPSSAYLHYLYKYPQQAFPYEKLIEGNLTRTSSDPEYELIDTGVFDDNRYFDIHIEYAKFDAEDIAMRITAYNRGPDSAPLHILPQIWFRNTWSWSGKKEPKPAIMPGKEGREPCLEIEEAKPSPLANLPFPYELGKRYLYASHGAELLFTENETRNGLDDHQPKKDAFERKIVHRDEDDLPEKGSKAALHYRFASVAPGSSVTVYLRLSRENLDKPLEGIDLLIEKRRNESDEFYETVHPKGASKEEREIQRHAFASLIWNQQIYLYDVEQWLKGDAIPAHRHFDRNVHWQHLNSMRILFVPDKWEYPWFAAWDQAFHCLTIALIDIERAKEQLWLLLFDQFQHPNGEIPACEWEFSDLNPPVQAWVVWQLYQMQKEKEGKGDRAFLEKCFHKLLMNFSWWVNKVDSLGNNVFEGGFLGLDNIAVLDRSEPLPSGAVLQQSDGTGWMAMLCLNLMRIALELAVDNSVYESLATKFFEHFVYIAAAMKKRGNCDYEMWSDRDGFFYDVLTFPDGHFEKFRVRSLVGIIPIFACEVLDEEQMRSFPSFYRSFNWFLNNRKELVDPCVFSLDKNRYLLSLVDEEHLRSILSYVWNPDEFRSEFGLRSLSKYHLKHPFSFEGKTIRYEPAESLEKIKGGNSNWRGPIWFPTNYIFIESLNKFSEAFGNEFKLELPGEKPVTLREMSLSFSDRLLHLFLRNEQGHRPFFGESFPFDEDPHWSECFWFYEYFHPETGKGLGASQQAGWTALVANLIEESHLEDQGATA